MADDFKFKIAVEGADAAAAGTEKVAEALRKTGKAASDTGKEARTLGEDLTSLGSRQNATKDVVEGLDGALKGNANSMFGVAKAAKNLWEIFTVSTPAGRALQLALIGVHSALTFLPALFGKTAENSEEAAKKFEDFRKVIEKFAASEGAASTKRLEAMKDQASGLAAELDRVISLREKIDQASGDTPSLARAREDMKLGAQFSSAQDAVERARGNLGVVDVVSGLEQSVAAHEGRLSQRDKLVRQLAALPPMVTGPGAAFGPGLRINAQRADLMRQIGAFASDVSPEGQATFQGQRDTIERLKPDAEAALKALREAEEAFRRLAGTVVGVRADGSAIRDPSVAIARGIEDRNAREAAGEPETVSQTGSFSSVGSTFRAAVAEGRISIKNAAGEEQANKIADRIEANNRAADEQWIRILDARLKREAEERARRLKAIEAQH